MKGSALREVYRRPYSSTGSFHNWTADRQSHSHAGRLGCVKRIEKTIEVFLAYARPGIPDRDDHTIWLVRLSADLQLAYVQAALTHCLDRVQDQVEDHLLKLGPISCHGRQAFGKLRLYRNAVFHGFTPRELDHPADRFIDMQGLHLRRR